MSENATVLIRLTTRPEGGKVIVLHVDGEGREVEIMSLPAGGPPDHKPPNLTDIVRNEIAKGNRRFAIDFTQVSWMNSAGLGWLIGLWRGIMGAKGVPVLICKSQRFMNQLKVAKLDELFRIRDSMTSAQQYLDGAITQGDT